MQTQKFRELYTCRVCIACIYGCYSMRINWKSKRSIDSWHWSIYPTRLNQATDKKNKGSKESITVMPVQGVGGCSGCMLTSSSAGK